MKTVLVSIGLCLAATAVHSMPLPLLNANGAQPVIAVSDQCGDRCGSFRSYVRDRRAVMAGYSGGYVLVRDPLIQRRPYCPFGSYVACIMSGTLLRRSLPLRVADDLNSKSPAEECSPCCCRCPRVCTRHRHRNRSSEWNSTADRWEHCRRHLPSSGIGHRPPAFPRRRNCSGRRRHRRNKASRLFVASRVCPVATTEALPPFPAWSHTSRQNLPG